MSIHFQMYYGNLVIGQKIRSERMQLLATFYIGFLVLVLDYQAKKKKKQGWFRELAMQLF